MLLVLLEFSSLNTAETMPPKPIKKRQMDQNLEKAREVKRRRESGEGASGSAEIEVRIGHGETDAQEGDLSALLTMSEDALDTDDEAVDPSVDLDTSMKSDIDHLVESFCEDWDTHLGRDERVFLGLFLTFQLTKQLNLGETKAAELAGLMIGKSDRTVREWKTHFLENNGEIPESKQGRYQRTGVMWGSEDLNKKAVRFIRENANVKWKPNLTVGTFCQWVNDDLLPNETLEPGFPRKIAVETVRKWMHELGFYVVLKKKGTFVDGHERVDVVEYRKTFIRRLVALGFLNNDNVPTDEAKKALPTDLHSPDPEGQLSYFTMNLLFRPTMISPLSGQKKAQM